MLLIIIGVLAVLTNLGIVTATIWNWWPILFVILGIYLLVWQRRKKRLLKSLLFYGAIHKFLRSDKVEKLLKNEKIQEELKKVGDIVEGVITEQINKLHRKYSESEEKKPSEEVEGVEEEK